MKRVIVIDFSVIRDFGDLQKWDELFPLFTRDDDLIFTAADLGDLNRCKDFFGAKTSIEYIDNNFIAHEVLIKSLQKKYERIKENPENNRFIFWGLPFYLMDELVHNYGSLEDRFRPFGIKNKANIEETFFGNEFYGSYPLDSDGRFLSFDCSNVNFFENFFSYIKNIVNENECLNMRIKEIKKHKEKKLSFETILNGKDGIYDKYSFTVEEMLEMVKVIPACVEEVDLRTCFNSMRSQPWTENCRKILENIPKTVKKFNISLHQHSEKLYKTVAEKFEKESEGIFLNQPSKQTLSQESARSKQRSQTLPAGAAMSSIPSKSEIKFRREGQTIENVQQILKSKLEIIKDQKETIEQQQDIIIGLKRIIEEQKKEMKKLNEKIDTLSDENDELREDLDTEMEKNATNNQPKKEASSSFFNKPEDIDQCSGSSSDEEPEYVRLRFSTY